MLNVAAILCESIENSNIFYSLSFCSTYIISNLKAKSKSFKTKQAYNLPYR